MRSKLQLTAPALSIVLSLFILHADQPLHVKQPAVERPRMVQVDEEGTAVRHPAKSAEDVLPPEDHRLLVCRAQVPWLDFVHSFPVKKRTFLCQ